MIVICIVGALAAGAVGAGCGGGDSEAKIDKAEFAEQASTVCKQASGKMTAEIAAYVNNRPEYGFNPLKIQLTLLKTTLLPGLEAELRELRALGMPEGAEGQARAFFREGQKVIAAAEANPKKFVLSGSAYDHEEVAARRLGVVGCPVAAPETS